jgi:hypothetical protein
MPNSQSFKIGLRKGLKEFASIEFTKIQYFLFWIADSTLSFFAIWPIDVVAN